VLVEDGCSTGCLEFVQGDFATAVDNAYLVAVDQDLDQRTA
jgi:hypothetical protein